MADERTKLLRSSGRHGRDSVTTQVNLEVQTSVNTPDATECMDPLIELVEYAIKDNFLDELKMLPSPNKLTFNENPSEKIPGIREQANEKTLIIGRTRDHPIQFLKAFVVRRWGLVYIFCGNREIRSLPDVYLLDDPFSHLHDISLVKLCIRYYFLRKGFIEQFYEKRANTNSGQNTKIDSGRMCRAIAARHEESMADVVTLDGSESETDEAESSKDRPAEASNDAMVDRLATIALSVDETQSQKRPAIASPSQSPTVRKMKRLRDSWAHNVPHDFQDVASERENEVGELHDKLAKANKQLRTLTDRYHELQGKQRKDAEKARTMRDVARNFIGNAYAEQLETRAMRLREFEDTFGGEFRE